MGKERAERFNELIKKELGKILFDFLETPPGVLATITRVLTSANLFTAEVFVSVYPTAEAENIMKKLTGSVYHIQQLLNKQLKVRPVPKIIFHFDKNPEEASRVEALIEEIKEENEKP